MIRLPEGFVSTIKNGHKDKGENWLLDLDRLISECESRWEMKIGDPFDLSFNFVAPAIRSDGTDVVVKLVVPGEEFHFEVEALRFFNGKGIAQLIDVDLDKGILILERLRPGSTLASLENDEEATYIASQVMKKLWIPAPHTSMVPTTVQMEKKLLEIHSEHKDGIGPISSEILKEAVETYGVVNGMMSNPYFLHGDLHHYNILKTGSQSWLAIDPKGLIGVREYDIIQYLLNKLPHENIVSVIEKRIEIFVEQLGLDKNMILSCGFAHSVLATTWTVQEDGCFDEKFFAGMNAFRSLGKEFGSL
ncbi:MAG: aminoglycoside phosphotransferase family protein [Bacillota bacterium]|nr:aminoglycoside phosphotransferase family protein [Bacillota bacterium]